MTAKADRVKELLDNEHFQDAVKNVREMYTNMLIQAPINSSDENLSLVLDIKKMLQALNDVEADLREEVARGQMEDFNAEQERQPTFLGDINGSKH